MANFVTVTTPMASRPAVKAWLTDFESPVEECLWIEHNDNFSTLIVATHVFDSLNSSQSHWFRGTAVVEEIGVVAFGAAAFIESNLQPGLELLGATGEFISVHWDHEGVVVQRDFFTSVSLAWTQIDEVFATSDSILVLASLRKAMRATSTFDSEIALARCPFSSFTEQQMETRTLIKEIGFVPAAQGLRYSFNSGNAQLFGDKIAESSITDSPIFSNQYAAEIRKSAIWAASLVKGLGEQSRSMISLSLSGGYDSRVILTALSAAGQLNSSNISTRAEGRGDPLDFTAVKKLGAQFNIPIQFVVAPNPDTALTHPKPLQLWGSTLLGVYDRFTPNRVRPGNLSGKISLTGMGAEILKGNWGFRSWNQICQEIELPPMYQEAFKAAGLRGMASVGADPSMGDSSEWYYIGFRNGIHATAGHISNHMTAITPLHQRRFVAMAHKSTGSLVGFPKDPPMRIADLNILLDPAIAQADYDRKDRNLDRAFVQHRLEFLGGAIETSEIEAARIWGDPSDVPGGSSQLSLNIAKSHGLDLDANSESIMNFIDSHVQDISAEELAAPVQKLRAKANHHLVVEGRNLFSNTSAAGKLLSFITLSRISK